MITPETLRAVTEDDVIAALEDASFGAWPQDEAGLLEFWNLMVDRVLGEGAASPDYPTDLPTE